MKRQSVNLIAKKLFLGNILVAVLFLSAQNKSYASHSLPKAGTVTDIKTSAASVKYLGSNTENLFFAVKYDNSAGNAFTVLVVDETGEVIYRAVYKEKQFEKTFLLPRYSDYRKFSFIIKEEKTNFHQSFDISINTKTVEDVVVTKS